MSTILGQPAPAPAEPSLEGPPPAVPYRSPPPMSAGQRITPPNPDQPLNLTPADLAGQRKALREGGGAGLRQWWEDFHATRRHGDPAATTDQAQLDAGEALEGGPEPTEADFGRLLTEATGGALEVGQLEALGQFTEPAARRFEMAAARGEEALAAEIEAGEAEVVRFIYAGSEEALSHGLSEIRQAAEALGGQALIDQIDASGILADSRSHKTLLAMARGFNKRMAR